MDDLYIHLEMKPRQLLLNCASGSEAHVMIVSNSKDRGPIAKRLILMEGTRFEPGSDADPKLLQEKLLKSAVEGGIRMLLQLLDHLVNAEQLLASPQAASLLTTPIPGSKASKPSTAEDLVTSIQVCPCILPRGNGAILRDDPPIHSTTPFMHKVPHVINH